MDFDIIIVGAGPGGTTCALRLADSNLRVALLDKSVFPRDKICGDALSGKVISVLRYAAPKTEKALHKFPPKIDSWGIRFVAPSNEILDIPFKTSSSIPQDHAPGYIATRLDFDQFLMDQVKAHDSITVLEDFDVKEIQKIPEGIEVSSSDQSLRGKIIIGADGAHSIVTKRLGNFKMEKRHHCAGIRAYYKGVTGYQESNFIELHFNKSLLPGYFWIFPLPNGMANVGLGMRSDDVSRNKINLKEKLKEIIEEDPRIASRFANATLSGKVLGFGLPLGSKQRKISGNRFMLVGDAASLIDPFSGEGIGNAMLSGKIAAEQAIKCLESNDFSSEFMSQYDEAVYKKVGTELKISTQLQRLANYPWLFNFVARKANRNASIQKMLSMMFDQLDIRKELSKPSFYWKLLWG